MSLRVGQAVARVGTRSDDFNLETEVLPRVDAEVAARNIERVRRSSGERWSVAEQVVEPAADDGVAAPEPLL